MFQPVRQVSVNFADNEKQSNKTFNILYFMKTNLVNLALGLALQEALFLVSHKKMTWFSNIREIR
mgnify:CR=1 FL=1